MLAALFLAAIWIDQSQPAQAPAATYALLALYLLWAIALAVVSWSSWWFDARLAGPAHLVDIGVFTAIVFSTEGYTSPFFLFFVFLLLVAAIRWGWRETALTAIVLVVLYLTAGLIVAGSTAEFEQQRFVIRSGHLLILSALLIWFGINQRFARLSPPFDELRSGLPSETRARALAQAMGAVGARSGVLTMRESGENDFAGPVIVREQAGVLSLRRAPFSDGSFGDALIFDLRRDRALTVTERRRSRFGRARALFDPDAAEALPFAEGIACEVRTGTAEGWLLLGEIDSLSPDHVELGRELGIVVAGLLERQELLSAIEEGAAARARLTLARDLHDSVVQFLAGAAFRLEAIRRSAPAGEAFESDLADLKNLVLEEQREIRGFVSALRRGPDLDLGDALSELRALTDRLGQQWAIRCDLHGRGNGHAIPVRVHLDVQQLLREAVANSVRHGGADQVDVSLALDNGELQLEVSDNGSGFVKPAGGGLLEPWSLKERVDRANGSLMLVSVPGRTTVSIALPLKAQP